MDVMASAPARVFVIAGLWKRFFAFILDCLFLGAIGAAIGVVAFNDLAALGDWGRALGFFVALIYFGIMDSAIWKGRTIGQRIVGIKVVTANGLPLVVPGSMIRATIFCVPYFLNGALIDLTDMAPWISILISWLVFGVGLSIGYLLLFNRGTRQSLHDLAVGAYVVTVDTDGRVSGERSVSAMHFFVVIVIMLVSIAIPHLVQLVAKSESFATLLSAQQSLEALANVRHAAVNQGVNKSFSSGKGTVTTHVFSARVILSQRVTELDPLANQLVEVILERDPSAKSNDVIEISIAYGYDIGIASSWQTQSFSFSPAQWRKRIAP